MITENNWLQSNICELKTNKDLPYITCEYEPSNFKPSTFREASIITAYRIKEKYKNIYVAYSGGADSQFILDRLCEVDANPKPVFVDVYYSHAQLKQVKKYCEYLGIEPIIISIPEKAVARIYEEKTIYDFVSGMFNTFYYLLIAEYVKQIHSDAIIVIGQPSLGFMRGMNGVDFEPDLFENLTNVVLPFLWYTPQQAYEMLSTIKKLPMPIKEIKNKLYGTPYSYKKHQNVIKDWDAYRIEVKNKVTALWRFDDLETSIIANEMNDRPPPTEGVWNARNAKFKRKAVNEEPKNLVKTWRNFKK